MYSSNSHERERNFTPENTIYLGVSDTFHEPLVPPSNDSWPEFNTVDAFTYTPQAPTFQNYFSAGDEPTAQSSNNLPPSTSTSPSIPQRRRSGHIPRPRNAFMIYRSTFTTQQRIPTGIEHDHRHISRIIAHCWNNLPEPEKQIWRDKADAEKADHARKYPGYRFTPISRLEKPVKRRVRRNGAKDMDRCRIIADLILAGKQGEDLEGAIKQIDLVDKRTPNTADGIPDLPLQEHGKAKEIDLPPFESPILPPSDLWQAVASGYPSTPSISPVDRGNDPPFLSLTNESTGTCGGYDSSPSTSTLTEFQSAYQGYLHSVESSISPLDLPYDDTPPSLRDDTHFVHSSTSHVVNSPRQETWDPIMIDSGAYHKRFLINNQYR